MPDREPKDHGGHFIAREFGGPEIPYNHFAQKCAFAHNIPAPVRRIEYRGVSGEPHFKTSPGNPNFTASPISNKAKPIRTTQPITALRADRLASRHADNSSRKSAMSFARAAKAGVPLLWQHDTAKRIGFVESLSEDERGLRVIAQLDGDEPAIRAGSGLSFGYPGAN